MKSGAVLIVFAALGAATTWAAGPVESVICANGAKHTMRLTEVESGTLGSRQGRSIDIGPTAQAWIKLPSGAKLLEHQPIPVPNVKATSIDVLVERSGGRSDRANVAVRRSAADGFKQVELIQARISSYSYALPDGCRVMSEPETKDYALALLNNAGCLLSATMHRRLRAVPGASGRMQKNCGWAPDTEAAIRALEKSSDRGSMHAGWVLSQFYLGNLGAEYANHQRAYGSLSRTAGVGHASADLMTAVMRWRGDGVQPDAKAAFSALLPHARTGSKEAQGIIGMMYLTGDGAPVNRKQAYAWCSLAEEGAPLLHSDPVACRGEAEAELSYNEVLDARDLAVEIHNGDW
ncbi:MAG: hypothetical protein OES38_10095 [Gammaproteobacteria bacterium]|nr:hypothetical protein [Gammaproteobacteria bacterium]